MIFSRLVNSVALFTFYLMGKKICKLPDCMKIFNDIGGDRAGISAGAGGFLFGDFGACSDFG